MLFGSDGRWIYNRTIKIFRQHHLSDSTLYFSSQVENSVLLLPTMPGDDLIDVVRLSAFKLLFCFRRTAMA